MSEINSKVYATPEAFHNALKQMGTSDNIAQENTKEEVKNEQLPEENTTISISEDNQPTEEINVEQSNTEENKEGYKENKYIPKSRFNEVNEAKKQLEEQVLKEREDRIRLEEQLKVFKQQQEQAQIKQSPQRQEEVQTIDPLDPESHRYYETKINNLESQIKQVIANTQAQTEALYKQTLVSSQKSAFEKKAPDYQEAINYLTNFETKRAQRMFKSQDQINQYLNNELYRITNNALENGRNVAEEIYEMAKDAGYNTKGNGANGSTPSPSLNGANLEAINNNMKKSAGIDNFGSGIGVGGIGKISSIKQTLINPKSDYSAVDPKKFHEALRKA